MCRAPGEPGRALSRASLGTAAGGPDRQPRVSPCSSYLERPQARGRSRATQPCQAGIVLRAALCPSFFGLVSRGSRAIFQVAGGGGEGAGGGEGGGRTEKWGDRRSGAPRTKWPHAPAGFGRPRGDSSGPGFGAILCAWASAGRFGSPSRFLSAARPASP